MAFVKKTYGEIRDSILAQITKGVVNEEHTYEPTRTMYELANTPVKSIVKIEGFIEGERHIFQQNIDYKLTGNMVEWLAERDKPDERTLFTVNYVFGAPSTLTDINPGSVARTIVEAVSREVEFLYEQLNQVYLAGFIDTSSGSALDLVVPLIGVERKPAEHATGKVTFGRSTDPAEIQVSREAHLFDGKTRCELTNVPVKSVAKVEGFMEGASYTFKPNVDYALTEKGIEWLAEGKQPDSGKMFHVDYIAYEQIRIPAGTPVSTYSRVPTEVTDYITTKERGLKKTEGEAWEVDIPVTAAVPGSAGNVYAGAISVMPKPLMGVEYVINREDILNGLDEEADGELRQRAKHALEVAGKATLVSLEAGVRGIEGVDSVLVEDMPDNVQGIVRIIVDGGNDNEILKTIDDVRAAGVRVEFLRPRAVHIDTSLTVVLQQGVIASRVLKDVEAKIRNYLSSLNIGEDVIFSRLIGAIVSVDGVYDTESMTVKAYKKETEQTIMSVKENITISNEERAVARAINLLIKASGEDQQ